MTVLGWSKSRLPIDVRSVLLGSVAGSSLHLHVACKYTSAHVSLCWPLLFEKVDVGIDNRWDLRVILFQSLAWCPAGSRFVSWSIFQP